MKLISVVLLFFIGIVLTSAGAVRVLNNILMAEPRDFILVGFVCIFWSALLHAKQ